MLALNNGSFFLLISTAYTYLLHQCACLSRSVNSFLCQLGLVLVFDADSFESLKLLGLDALHLKTFVLKPLAHLTALFQVVKALLFSKFRVLLDLSADSVSMVPQVLLLLLVDLPLVLLFPAMLFDDGEEGVTFEFSLLAKHLFFLHELLLASNVEILGLLPPFLGVRDFFPALSSLILLESTFLTQCIDLCLAIGCPFLEVTQPLYFAFLFILELFLLRQFLLDSRPFLCLVLDNCQVFCLLFGQLILFLLEGDGVSLLDFSDHFLVALLLLFNGKLISFLHGLNIFKHLRFFLFENLALLDTLLLAFCDLVDDNLGTGLSSVMAALVTFFLLLE